MTKVLTWNGVPSTSIPGLEIASMMLDPVGEIRTSLVGVPGKEGAWVFPQRQGRKRLAVECWILRDTQGQLEDSKDLLSSWLDVEGQAALVLSTKAGRYYEASLLDAQPSFDWRGRADYSLEWSLNPYSLDELITTEIIMADNNHNHVWDAEAVVYLYPVIEITPTNGTLTGFIPTLNGDSIVYSNAAPTILSGQTITINSISSAVTAGVNTDTELTGAYNPATSVLQWSFTSGFPLIVPGVDNELDFVSNGGTATAFTITVHYRKRFSG